MQQILNEMTKHLEQQNASQRYLERLRAENEHMIIQEKERQVEGLCNIRTLFEVLLLYNNFYYFIILKTISIRELKYKILQFASTTIDT